MSEEKLKLVFSTVLEIPEGEITDDLSYQKAKGWDSIGHMAIIAGLDKTFDIAIDMDDVIAMSSYGLARDIMKKYGVSFE